MFLYTFLYKNTTIYFVKILINIEKFYNFIVAFCKELLYNYFNGEKWVKVDLGGFKSSFYTNRW